MLNSKSRNISPTLKILLGAKIRVKIIFQSQVSFILKKNLLVEIKRKLDELKSSITRLADSCVTPDPNPVFPEARTKDLLRIRDGIDPGFIFLEFFPVLFFRNEYSICCMTWRERRKFFFPEWSFWIKLSDWVMVVFWNMICFGFLESDMVLFLCMKLANVGGWLNKLNKERP